MCVDENDDPIDPVALVTLAAILMGVTALAWWTLLR